MLEAVIVIIRPGHLKTKLRSWVPEDKLFHVPVFYHAYLYRL